MHHGTRLRCSGWGVLKNVDSGHVVVVECGFLTTACENIGLPKIGILSFVCVRQRNEWSTVINLFSKGYRTGFVVGMQVALIHSTTWNAFLSPAETSAHLFLQKLMDVSVMFWMVG